jgi:RimJ/RimL family protein N-acetyltransferase
VTGNLIPTLETARLLLRPYRREDFADYVVMWQEPEVYRFIGGQPIVREQAWTMFLRQIGLWYHMGFGFWALELKATGEFVGECGFQERRRNISPSIEGTMESGWGLRAAFQGQGFAAEAMRAALDWARDNATPERMTAIIDLDNTASLRLAERLSFVEATRTTYNGTPIILFERPRRGSANATAANA